MRDDELFQENIVLAFDKYVDENELTNEECDNLADSIGHELLMVSLARVLAEPEKRFSEIDPGDAYPI